MSARTTILAIAIWLGLSPQAGAQGTAGQAGDQAWPIRVTVVPFASVDGDQDAWLGKAIADLLSRKLAETPAYAVLDRERLQTFLDEMELQASGFFAETEADRLGRIAKVEQVVYGNFRHRKNSLTIDLLLVDLVTQQGLRTAQANGSLDTLHELVASLALQVLSFEGVTPSPDLYARIRFSPTASLSATEHFYKAFDHLDHGQNEEAFGAFYAATQQDPDFREAELWMGRMLESLGYEDLAVVAYDKLARRPGRRVEQLDALFFKARLSESHDPAAAVAAYRELMALHPATPHTLEAAFRLGMVLERQGDAAGAYDAFALVDAFREISKLQEQNGRQTLRANAPASAIESLLTRVRRIIGGATTEEVTPSVLPLYLTESGLRRSRFFDWDHALGLYREAILKMVLLLPELPPESESSQKRELPRGVFLLSPEFASIVEQSFSIRPSLFHEEDQGPNWREKFYAIVLPKGYLATGVEMEISGRVHKQSPRISYAMRLLPFPWPPNYHNAWLGTIYGQTVNTTTLRKQVNFHGQPRQALALQFIENHAEIREWRLNVKLRPVDELEMAILPRRDVTGGFWTEGFWEGKKVGHIPARPESAAGPALPLFEYLQHPRLNLSLANSYSGGLHLVTVGGELGGRTTDLWWSHSADGTNWSEPQRLPVNSASEDYAPRLLWTERGDLRLFWLSDRRGRGWEIWTSLKPRGDTAWQLPTRVSLDSFDEGAPVPPGTGPHALLQFAVMQDRRGRWLLAYARSGVKRVVMLISEDARTWKPTGNVTPPTAVRSLVLSEDHSGRYLLGGTTGDGRFRLWRSNDLSNWQRTRAKSARHTGGAFGTVGYPSYLFAEPSGKLLLLMSDHLFGLQYARIDPDYGPIQLDLAKDAGLEAYAATALEDGSYLVALEGSDGIDLRRYRQFQSPHNGDNAPSGRIYTEVEVDQAGNRWHRTFARHRFIEPDVTAIATEADGRVWWGIETGVMSVRNSDFFMQDVSMGFFTHNLADIQPCGDTVYFAALYDDQDRLAMARANRSITGTDNSRTDYAVEVISLPDVGGAVTALSCIAGDGAGEATLLVGTSGGDLLALRRHEVLWHQRLAERGAVTSIASDATDATLYAGTTHGHLYRLKDGEVQQAALPGENAAISALTIDRAGRLWIAREGQGLYRRDENGWAQFAPGATSFPYRSVAALQADPRRGVWALPSPEVISLGLAYWTDEGLQLFNPPSRRLARPIDIDVAADGALLIGTALNGFYRLERAHP